MTMMLSFVRGGQTGRRAEAHCTEIGGFQMCDKCTELDKQIAEYQRQIRSTYDMREVERLQAQVRELISQKIGFHSTPAS
jgi:hypothetical protein